MEQEHFDEPFLQRHLFLRNTTYTKLCILQYLDEEQTENPFVTWNVKTDLYLM